jgi:hypothetical protein
LIPIELLGRARLQKQLLAANELEARNIKQLEKQLGLARRKSKKLPKSFQEDGLDYVITACDSGTGAGDKKQHFNWAFRSQRSGFGPVPLTELSAY